jgi:sugar lactone lactonase YvrE
MTNLASANELTPLWQVDNFDQPESIVAAPAEQAIFISNINGQPTELNGKGYISKLSLDGEVLEKHWLENLNAPKGMGIHGDYLYIADMQQVHLVSISQARIIKQFQVSQAKMLNDITIADDGTVYISDLLGGGVYRIIDNQIALWFSDEKLPHPNGLLWQQGEMLVASWGLGMNNDFSTKTAGRIYSIDVKNPKLIPLAGTKELGNLDGIAKHKNKLYVSDWISGELFEIENDKSRKVLTLKPGLADITAARSVLFTPSMLDGQVRAWRVSPNH